MDKGAIKIRKFRGNTRKLSDAYQPKNTPNMTLAMMCVFSIQQCMVLPLGSQCFA